MPRRKLLTKEQRGEEGWNIDQRVKARELQRRKLFAENVKDIHEILSKQLYKDILGDETAEWTAYLGELEVYYPRNTIYPLMKIYEKFELEFEKPFADVCHIPKQRLLDIGRIIKSKDDLPDWLNKAETLLARDWRDEIRQYQGLPSTLDCNHDKMQLYEICKSCGVKHRK